MPTFLSKYMQSHFFRPRLRFRVTRGKPISTPPSIQYRIWDTKNALYAVPWVLLVAGLPCLAVVVVADRNSEHSCAMFEFQLIFSSRMTSRCLVSVTSIYPRQLHDACLGQHSAWTFMRLKSRSGNPCTAFAKERHR